MNHFQLLQLRILVFSIFLNEIHISDQTARSEETDEQLDTEEPEDSNAFSYARRDEYITDPNYDTTEDEIYDQRTLNMQK